MHRLSRVEGIVLVAAMGIDGAALAQAPALLPVQGYLTDGGGQPIDGPTHMAFRLYTQELGGTELYGDDQEVPVSAGRFVAYIGDGTPLDLSLFQRNPTLWVGIAVEGDPELPRFQIGSVPYAAFAAFANECSLLGGVSASAFSRSPHGHAWAELVSVPPGFADGTDDGVTYAPGAGLSLSGTTFSADTAYLQRRVAGVCAAGSAISSIETDGRVSCEQDDNTTYAPGTGLLLNATVFSVDTTYAQRRVSESCPPGQGIRQINADGTVMCDPMLGRLLDQTRGFNPNVPAQAANANVWLVPNYVPFVNVRASLSVSCSFDGDTAFQTLRIRPAIRANGATITNSPDDPLPAETPAGQVSVVASGVDSFDLTAGTTYELGLHFTAASPVNGMEPDRCRLVAQFFSR